MSGRGSNSIAETEISAKVFIRECRIPFTFSSNHDKIVSGLNIVMVSCWGGSSNYTCSAHFPDPIYFCQ